MDATLQMTGRQRFTNAYKWTVATLGGAMLAYASYWLPTPRLDFRLLVLSGVMIVVSSRLSVKIPHVNTNVTVSDAFIFLVLLLYGGFAGLLLALADGLFGGLRIRGKLVTVLFNCGMMVCSTGRRRNSAGD